MRTFGVLVVGSLLAAIPMWGQDSTSRPVIPPRTPPMTQDTLHYLKPLPAFFHSLLLPGWAQAKLDRKLTGSLFLVWEGLTLGMTMKAAGEVRYLERIGADSARLESKRQERQDWLILLVFNHLFAGLEAFVGSHLQDFPADVRLRAAPRGVGFQAVVPIRIP